MEMSMVKKLGIDEMGNPVRSRSLARCEALPGTETVQADFKPNDQAATVTLLGCFTTIATWSLCLVAHERN
jgi:hypothetical protein